MELCLVNKVVTWDQDTASFYVTLENLFNICKLQFLLWEMCYLLYKVVVHYMYESSRQTKGLYSCKVLLGFYS